MAGTKKESSHNVEFAKGGDTHMFGQQHTGEQSAGGTAHKVGADGKYAVGGSTKMFGFAGSQPATAGKTSAR